MRKATPVRGRLAAPVVTEPRFGTAWAALLYAACVLALMYPALGGQFLVNPSSDFFSGYGYRAFGQEMLRTTGDFAQWNSLILGGLPFIAGQHGDIFYPTFILRELMRADSAWNVGIALHLILAGLFTFRFLRAWGLGFHPSLAGGLTYMLSGQIASLVSPGHDGKLYVSALAPLVLWMIVRGVRDGRIWAFGVLALAGGLSVLTPHFQMTYYLAMLAAGFTLYLAFSKDAAGGDMPRAVRIRRLAMAAGAGALGLGIAAIHFLPLLEYIPFSPRAGPGRGWEWSTSYSMPPEELLNGYLPQFSGILENYWGRNFFKLHGEYLGAAALVLAGAAFGSPTRRSFLRFWIVSGVLALLVAFGGHTPFYRLWYLLPMMKAVRAPSMIFFVCSLAVAVFAAVGLERFIVEGNRKRYLIGWLLGAGVFTLLAMAGIVEGFARSIAPAQKVDYVAGNASAMQLGALRSLLFVGLAVGTLWLQTARRVPATVAAWVLAAIVAIDLWSVDRVYYRFSPPASELYGSDEAIDYLKKLREPGRVIALPLADMQVQNDPFLNGDALMIHGVRALTGHQGNELQRWVELAGAKSPAAPQNAFASPQFRRLANGKYIFTNTELPSVINEFGGLRTQLRIGPIRNSVGSTVYLYEILEDNPAAWVVPAAVRASPEEIRAAVLDPRLDLAAIALVDSTATGIATQALSAPPAPLAIRASVPEYRPGRIRVELDGRAPQGSTLIVSENWYPGWMALVDGRPVATWRVDHTLIGVPLSAGASRIELTFRDRAYARGRAVTVVALILTALLIAGGAAQDIRARRARANG